MQITSTNKIVAGLLAFAMVLTLVVGLSAVSANAQTTTTTTTTTTNATYSRNLTIGSRGADVTSLQAMLNAGGFLAVSPTGYFGTLTRAALAAWQASVGVSPAAGYFGPITRAKIAMGGTVTGGTTGTVAGCMPGALYSSTTGQSCAGAPTTGTLDNSDGSASVSLSTYASDTTIKEGETKDMIAVKVQATAGKVAVNRFDVRINNRPWLYFSKLTLKDSNGTVVATKSLSSSSDATEITVGSDYLVRFEGLNYVVSPGVDQTLVVSGTVLSNTERINTNSPTLIVSVPNASIRTVNGKGFTDSLGLGTVAVAGTTGRTITLTDSGTRGNVVARVSPSTPASRIVTTSTSGQTNDVVLGTFDLKAENTSGTINTLSFNIATSSSASSLAAIFKNIRLTDGTNTYNASVVGSGTTTFSNLNISLPQDSWKTLTVKADIADQDEFTSGTMASTTLNVNTSTVVGVDANFNTLTVTSGSPASNNVTFMSTGLTISAPTASYTLNGGTSGSRGAGVTFSFTATNNGSTDVFISKIPGVALGTSTAGSAGSPVAASSTLTYVVATGGAIGGDTGDAPTSGAYVVPAGSSRTFTFTGSVDNTNGTAGLRVFKISSINFGTSAGTPTGSSISFGLENLVVTPNLSAS